LGPSTSVARLSFHSAGAPRREGANPDASKLRKRFKAAVRCAGVREVRFHDLRHSYGTAMAAAGAPLRSLMEWIGHADLQTTLRYADYPPGEAAGAAFAEQAFGARTTTPAVRCRRSRTHASPLLRVARGSRLG
jgi:integrase